MQEIYRTHEYSVIEVNKHEILIVANILKITNELKIDAVKRVMDIMKERYRKIPKVERRRTRYWSLRVFVKV